MADPPPIRLSENNNEPSSDSSYVHKKFKKVAAFFETSVPLTSDGTADSLNKQRKRSSNSFSFETASQPAFLQDDGRPAFAGSSRIACETEPARHSHDIQCDTVDSKNVGQKERTIKFGIRDIIDEAAPSVKWDNFTRDDAFIDSHRKRCISEGPMMHPVLVRPKIQRFDNHPGESSAIKQLLLQNSSVVYPEPQKEVVRRPVSDFSINNLMKPSQSAIQHSGTNVRTFHPSSVFQPPGDKVRRHCPNRAPSASSLVVPSGPSVSFSVSNSGRMYPSAVPPVLHNYEVPKQQAQAVVDLSARRKEVMSRGLPLVSNYQSVAMPSPKDEKNKSRKDDSPRVVRELKFHNYTVDSVPYLISPTKSRAFVPEKTKDSEVMPSSSDEVKKFSRPTSLSLKPGSFQRKKICMSGMDSVGIPRFQDGGHVLISPDTPRPSKAYNQTFVNGYSYTTLGLKCSTRVYFCCLSKPQPMYVVQETDPKLSMYSQWQIRPLAIDLSQPALATTQFMSSYDSRQRRPTYTLASSKNGVEMIITPSKKEKLKVEGTSVQQEPESETPRAGESAISEGSCSDIDPDDLDDSPLDMTKKNPTTETCNNLQHLSSAVTQIETSSSEGEGERMTNSPIHSLEDRKDEEQDLGNDMDDNVSVKTEVDEESGDRTSDRIDNLEVPCSSKSDPDSLDLFDSEGSPESLVRRITDNIRNGKKTIGRGPSPLFNVCDGEGRSTCHFCQKVFSKASQLRLHINIHYIERPFKCAECGVSFRNKGHLKKHLQSAIHLSKVNKNGTFGIPSEENPRPFKCSDCLVAFRIHGHLAKHLRSKSHIMKLECNGKLPFGTYAEIERSGINVNEIDTTDCQNTLDSLKALIVQRFGRLQRERRVDWEDNTSSS